VKTNVK